MCENRIYIIGTLFTNDLVKKNVNKSFTIFYLLMGNLTTNFDLPITKAKDFKTYKKHIKSR